MTRVYTRGGDRGETGLVGGQRVSKSDPRIVALGALDELSAILGLVRVETGPGSLRDRLALVQRELLAIGTRVGTPRQEHLPRNAKLQLPGSIVARLESWIDECDAHLPPLTQFLLPGGSRSGAFLHLARATCRRAESAVAALAAREPLEDVVQTYLNRLSDWLFVLAREVNQREGSPEETW